MKIVAIPNFIIKWHFVKAPIDTKINNINQNHKWNMSKENSKQKL